MWRLFSLLPTTATITPPAVVPPSAVWGVVVVVVVFFLLFLLRKKVYAKRLHPATPFFGRTKGGSKRKKGF